MYNHRTEFETFLSHSMAAKQFLLRLLSDYALLSAFAAQTSPRNLFRLAKCSRELWKAVHRGATSQSYDLAFSEECARVQLQRALARSWFHCNSMNPRSVPCQGPVQRCYTCPNQICAVSAPETHGRDEGLTGTEMLRTEERTFLARREEPRVTFPLDASHAAVPIHAGLRRPQHSR